MDLRETTLATWEIDERFSKITLPTLVINGEEDIAQDSVIQGFLKFIPQSFHVKFPKTSHTPFWENGGAYMAAIQEFLL